MNRLALIIVIVILKGCISTKIAQESPQTLPYNAIACYEATLDSNIYTLGLFPHNTYIFGRNRGQILSLGHYENKNGILHFSSFIQSFDEIPMIVKESFVPELDSAIVKLSVVSGLAFLGNWIGFSPSSIDVNGINFSNGLSIVNIDFDSIYSTKYKLSAQHKAKEILLKGRTLPTDIRYSIKDSTSNYFEWFYLHFNQNQFNIFEPSKIKLDTATLKISAFLLDSDIKDKSLILEFKKMKKVQVRNGLHSTPEGAILSAYRLFTAGGRLELVTNKKE